MLYRLYKASFLTGLLLSAPIVLGVLWYAWSAFAELDRYRRSAKVKDEPLDAELFQIALHDELTSDLRRMRLDDRPARSALPTFSLALGRTSLDQLNRRGGKEGEESYAPALLEKDGKVVEVRVRYRGGQPWHLLGAQKSMKVRVDRGQLVDGDRVFNLLNDPTPFGLEEQLILDLSRQLGLLTPDYRAVWVRLNNADLGVYRYESQPEEGLLRRSRRMPGSLYSGDTEAVDPKTGDGALFSSVEGWQKVASRTPEEAQDLSELERLVEAVSRGTHRQFARFAAEEVDLDRYAAFDALDVVFGNSEHDYFSNHKLYFDPYAGRFEPVAWSFRGFNHEPRMNLVDHPLLIRLKLTPGYLARRNRAALELLNGSASVPQVRAAAQRHFDALYPELAADPYWDAYKLLPRVSRFHRFMVRPMSRGRWALAADAELEDFARRSRFVVDQLESSSLEGLWGGGGGVVVRVGGQGGVRLTSATVSGDRCAGKAVQLLADADGDGRPGAGDVAVAEGRGQLPLAVRRGGELYTGVQLVAREDAQPKFGRVRVEPEPRSYLFWIRAEGGCRPGTVSLEAEDLVTRASRTLEIEPGQAGGSVEGFISAGVAAVDAVPAIEPGTRSIHPWAFGLPPLPEEVALGPGEVVLEEGRRFGAHQTVRIAAGTVLRVGAGQTVEFRGPVFAQGTATAPVQIVPSGGRPFGAVALLGPGTAGSRLSNVQIRGGSRGATAPVDVPGLLNIHHTRDVALEDVSLEASGRSEDLLHATAVDGLLLVDVAAHDAPVDAVDLELTRAEIRGLHVRGAGDDCLDLMASAVTMRDAALRGCAGNGISAGEETELAATELLVAGAKVGVLAKNASRVRLARAVLFRDQVALRTNFHQVHYQTESEIGADDLYAVACGTLADEDRGTTIRLERVQRSFPRGIALQHLLTRVLKLQSWSHLDPPALGGGAESGGRQ